MALIINTPKGTLVNYSVTLDTRTYKLKQRWCGRSGAWYLDVRTDMDEIIVLGAKMLPNIPLVTRNKHLFPSANLYVLKRIIGNDADVGRDTLGNDEVYALVYIPNEEITNA